MAAQRKGTMRKNTAVQDDQADVEQLAATARQRRARACADEVGAVLATHRCRIVPQVLIEGATITSGFAIVPE